MKKIFTAFIALLASAAVFAQSAESDFETKANKDGTVTVTKYVGWDTEVVIPAQIGGKAVTAIGAGAFENCGLTAVTIPESVKSIEAEAFRSNKLTSVVIPGSVTSIGGYAFVNAKPALKSVTLGKGLLSIGGVAFFGGWLS
jgi:hypothetical protein